MKKIGLIIIASIVLIALVIGGIFLFRKPKDTIASAIDISFKYQNRHKSTAIRMCDEDSLHVDYRKFVDQDAKVYDADLAKLGIVLDTEMYSWASMFVKKEENFQMTNVFGLLPFSDVTLIKLAQEDYETDKNDLSTFKLGHYDFIYNGKKYQLFFIIFKGTDRDFEWVSNIDIGCNDSSYTKNLSVEHPDWKNTLNHKGFDVTSSRACNKIDEYVNTYSIKGYTPIMFISGHSRGGSVANISAKHYTDLGYKTFCYTFASSLTTQDSSASSYANIFNVINSDDSITQIPPAYLGFTRYGVDKKVSVNTLSSIWNDYSNATYSYASISTLLSNLENSMPTRVSIYEMSSEYDDVNASSFGYATFEEAQAGLNAKIKTVSKIDNYQLYIKFSDIYYDSEEESFGFKWKYNPGFLLNVIPLYMNGISSTKLLEIISFAPAQALTLATSLTSLLTSANGMEYPHVPESYITIVNNSNK